MHGIAEIGDKKIVDQISSSYNKKLHYLDWSRSEVDSVDMQTDVFDLIDFQNWIAGGYKPHIKSFSECSKYRPFYAFGYFCEAIRLRDWVCPKGRTWSLYDFVDTYYINSSLKDIYQHYDEYRSYLIDEFKKQLSSIGVNDGFESIDVNLFERFRWMMSRFCDSRSEFMLNNFGYAFSIMSIPQIHETILSLPADVIRGGTFQVKVVNALDPRLVRDFDVFSHLRPYRITKQFTLKKKFYFKSIADELFKIIPFIKPMLVYLYRAKRYNSISVKHADITLLEGLDAFIPSYIDYHKINSGFGRLKSIVVGLHRIRS